MSMVCRKCFKESLYMEKEETYRLYTHDENKMFLGKRDNRIKYKYCPFCGCDDVDNKYVWDD